MMLVILDLKKEATTVPVRPLLAANGKVGHHIKTPSPQTVSRQLQLFMLKQADDVITSRNATKILEAHF